MEKSAEELLKAAATSTDEAAKVAELRAAIPATTAGIYLNAGSNGPLPREVDAAMRQVLQRRYGKLAAALAEEGGEAAHGQLMGIYWAFGEPRPTPASFAFDSPSRRP